MRIKFTNLSITIDSVTYTCNAERIEPDSRLILALWRSADENGDFTSASGELLAARSRVLKAAFTRKFPDAPEFNQTSRVFAQYSEWVYVVYNAKREHIEWAKDASRCGLIDNYILDYDPASGGEK